MLRKLYILDRNCVSLINHRVIKGQIIDQGKASFVRKLKSLDRPENFISLVLSCYEGGLGRRMEDISQYLRILNTECKSVESFYKSAKTDRQILLTKKEDFFSIHLKNQWEINFDRYESFVNVAINFIADKRSTKDAHKIKYEIIKESIKNNIAPNHPLSFLFLAALYGNEDARKIIKPKKIYNKTYNCLSDILGINRFAYWKFISTSQHPNGTPTFSSVDYITADKSLNNMYNLLDVSCISSIEQNDDQLTIKFRCNPSPKLFPNLSESEFFELIKELNLATELQE